MPQMAKSVIEHKFRQPMLKEIYSGCHILLEKETERRNRYLNSDLNKSLYNKVISHLLWNFPSLLEYRIKKYGYDGLHFGVSWNGPKEKQEIAISFEMGDGFGITLNVNDDGSIDDGYHT